MVEADVALNSDPHSHTNTTDPMPTNSLILPFLVLTMAGGCGVSNLMKQAGNNSWVCVEIRVGGVERGGEGEGWVKTQVSLSKPRPEREGAALTATTSPKWLPVRAPGRETVASRLSERESPPSLLSGWLVWAHARSLRRAGRRARLQ